MDDAAWSSDRTKVLSYRLLHHLREACRQAGDREIISVVDLASAMGQPEDRMQTAVTILEQNGLVSVQRTLGGNNSLWMSDGGLAQAERLHSAAEDVKTRRTACREALLDWAYASEHVQPQRALQDFFLDARAFVFGVPFLNHEAESAAEFLREAELVTMSGYSLGIAYIVIAKPGKICVENYDGNLSLYMRSLEKGEQNGSQNWNVSGTNVNVTHSSSEVRQEIQSATPAEPPTQQTPPDTGSSAWPWEKAITPIVLGVLTLIGVIAAAILTK